MKLIGDRKWEEQEDRWVGIYEAIKNERLLAV